MVRTRDEALREAARQQDRLTLATAIVEGTDDAVVSKDLPPFAVAVAVGVAARVVRCRFAPEIVAALQRIAWWDWERGRLAEGLEDFRRLDAAAFCRKYDPV